MQLGIFRHAGKQRPVADSGPGRAYPLCGVQKTRQERKRRYPEERVGECSSLSRLHI